MQDQAAGMLRNATADCIQFNANRIPLYRGGTLTDGTLVLGAAPLYVAACLVALRDPQKPPLPEKPLPQKLLTVQFVDPIWGCVAAEGPDYCCPVVDTPKLAEIPEGAVVIWHAYDWDMDGVPTRYNCLSKDANKTGTLVNLASEGQVLIRYVSPFGGGDWRVINKPVTPGMPLAVIDPGSTPQG